MGNCVSCAQEGPLYEENKHVAAAQTLKQAASYHVASIRQSPSRMSPSELHQLAKEGSAALRRDPHTLKKAKADRAVSFNTSVLSHTSQSASGSHSLTHSTLGAPMRTAAPCSPRFPRHSSPNAVVNSFVLGDKDFMVGNMSARGVPGDVDATLTPAMSRVMGMHSIPGRSPRGNSTPGGPASFSYGEDRDSVSGKHNSGSQFGSGRIGGVLPKRFPSMPGRHASSNGGGSVTSICSKLEQAGVLVIDLPSRIVPPSIPTATHPCDEDDEEEEEGDMHQEDERRLSCGDTHIYVPPLVDSAMPTPAVSARPTPVVADTQQVQAMEGVKGTEDPPKKGSSWSQMHMGNKEGDLGELTHSTSAFARSRSSLPTCGSHAGHASPAAPVWPAVVGGAGVGGERGSNSGPLRCRARQSGPAEDRGTPRTRVHVGKQVSPHAGENGLSNTTNPAALPVWGQGAGQGGPPAEIDEGEGSVADSDEGEGSFKVPSEFISSSDDEQVCGVGALHGQGGSDAFRPMPSATSRCSTMGFQPQLQQLPECAEYESTEADDASDDRQSSEFLRDDSRHLGFGGPGSGSHTSWQHAWQQLPAHTPNGGQGNLAHTASIGGGSPPASRTGDQLSTSPQPLSFLHAPVRSKSQTARPRSHPAASPAVAGASPTGLLSALGNLLAGRAPNPHRSSASATSGHFVRPNKEGATWGDGGGSGGGDGSLLLLAEGRAGVSCTSGGGRRIVRQLSGTANTASKHMGPLMGSHLGTIPIPAIPVFRRCSTADNMSRSPSSRPASLTTYVDPSPGQHRNTWGSSRPRPADWPLSATPKSPRPPSTGLGGEAMGSGLVGVHEVLQVAAMELHTARLAMEVSHSMGEQVPRLAQQAVSGSLSALKMELAAEGMEAAGLNNGCATPGVFSGMGNALAHQGLTSEEACSPAHTLQPASSLADPRLRSCRSLPAGFVPPSVLSPTSAHGTRRTPSAIGASLTPPPQGVPSLGPIGAGEALTGGSRMVRGASGRATGCPASAAAVDWAMHQQAHQDCPPEVTALHFFRPSVNSTGGAPGVPASSASTHGLP